jgi:hypothetical protein
MNACPQNTKDGTTEDIPGDLPSILLSGDNARTVLPLHHSLLNQGFRVQFAAYYELEAAWKRHRHPIVLLEVSGAHSVEAAVNAAMELKRHDPHQFVGYLADPVLHTSGLAGDAIFPRASEDLVKALRNHLKGAA